MAFIFLFQSKMLVTMKFDIYTYLNKIGGNFRREANEKTALSGGPVVMLERGPFSAEIFGDGGLGLKNRELDGEAFLEMPDDRRAQRADIQR